MPCILSYSYQMIKLKTDVVGVSSVYYRMYIWIRLRRKKMFITSCKKSRSHNRAALLSYFLVALLSSMLGRIPNFRFHAPSIYTQPDQFGSVSNFRVNFIHFWFVFKMKLARGRKVYHLDMSILMEMSSYNCENNARIEFYIANMSTLTDSLIVIMHWKTIMSVPTCNRTGQLQIFNMYFDFEDL